FEVWADCSWARLHDIANASLRVRILGFSFYDTQNNIAIIDDYAKILIRAAAALDIFETFTKRVCRDVLVNHSADADLLSLSLFGFPAGSKPVGFAGGVSVDLLEPYTFQTPCRTRAHIALIIPAIDDYRLILAQKFGARRR